MSHECPVNGCKRRVPANMLMDPGHWRMVPRPLQRAVWDAWRDGAGAGTPEHVDACLAARDAVNAKLAEPADA